MTLFLRRVVAVYLAVWSLAVLLVNGQVGWTLLLLVGSWLLWRRRTPVAPTAAVSPHSTLPTARRVTRSPSREEAVPYWLLPTAAAAGAAAVLHDREQEVAADAAEAAEEEDLCDPSYDAVGYGSLAAAVGEDPDGADADLDDGFGGYGGGGSWGGGADTGNDFGGSGGGGDWGGDFGDFGGGGEWGGGDDW